MVRSSRAVFQRSFLGILTAYMKGQFISSMDTIASKGENVILLVFQVNCLNFICSTVSRFFGSIEIAGLPALQNYAFCLNRQVVVAYNSTLVTF